IYSISLIPFLVVYFSNTAAITERFKMATYLSGDKSLLQNLAEFLAAYAADIGPTFLLLKGDMYLRHHIQGMGEIFVGTYILGVAGILIVLFRHLRSAWWRFILFGLALSIVPGALTIERWHSLRLLAFPIFFL